MSDKVVIVHTLTVVGGDDDHSVIPNIRLIQILKKPMQQIVLVSHFGIIEVIQGAVANSAERLSEGNHPGVMLEIVVTHKVTRFTILLVVRSKLTDEARRRPKR